MYLVMGTMNINEYKNCKMLDLQVYVNVFAVFWVYIQKN